MQKSHLSGINILRICEADRDSINATESNRPGHGRLLGNFYSRSGQKLEVFLNGFVKDGGLGPTAVAMRVKSRISDGRQRATNLYKFEKIIYTEEEMKKQRKDLKRLIHYAKSVACGEHIPELM